MDWDPDDAEYIRIPRPRTLGKPRQSWGAGPRQVRTPVDSAFANRAFNPPTMRRTAVDWHGSRTRPRFLLSYWQSS
jgi:hypothetical protein